MVFAFYTYISSDIDWKQNYSNQEIRIQMTSQGPDCNEVGNGNKIEAVNTNPIIKSSESFNRSADIQKKEESCLVLTYNDLQRIRWNTMFVYKQRKRKNLTAATEMHELKNTTSDSETFLGRFKQQNNEVSQQINPISGAYHFSHWRLNGSRHQEVSRYRL